MPARNGTGPSGSGPRTGRGMGNCSPARTSVNNTSISNTSASWPFSWGRRLWRVVGNGLRGLRRGRRNVRY